MILRHNGQLVEVNIEREGIGMFDIAYCIEDVEETMIQDIVDWLAENCKDNFVVTRTTVEIVAGGFVDNRLAAKQGRFNLSRKNPIEACMVGYKIKLSGYDNVLFSMVWVV